MSRIVISKVGRWTYDLTWEPWADDPDQSWMCFEGGRVYGSQRRAERVAARRLRHLNRIHGDHPTVAVIE